MSTPVDREDSSAPSSPPPAKKSHHKKPGPTPAAPREEPRAKKAYPEQAPPSAVGLLLRGLVFGAASDAITCGIVPDEYLPADPAEVAPTVSKLADVAGASVDRLSERYQFKPGPVTDSMTALAATAAAVIVRSAARSNQVGVYDGSGQILPGIPAPPGWQKGDVLVRRADGAIMSASERARILGLKPPMAAAVSSERRPVGDATPAAKAGDGPRAVD